ncbi:TPA: hypothetical protein ACQDGM_003252, partial [Legionella pneumophila]
IKYRFTRLRMKVTMNDELRKIISDPQKKEDLKTGLSKHLSSKQTNKIKIGGKTYTVKNINRSSR